MYQTLVNPLTNESRSIKSGFSWPLFLFTPFYGIPLFVRGLVWHGFAVALVALLAAAAIYSTASFVIGLLLLVAMFYYGINGNALTVARLLSKGWRFQSQPSTSGSDTASAPSSADLEKNCPECAEPVKAAARVCRYCGYAFDKGASSTPINVQPAGAAVMIAVLLIGALGSAALIAGDDPDLTQLAFASDAARTDVQAADPIEVSARELFAAYDANEQAAQTRYGGQAIRVSGVVAAIELDMNDEPMVSLEGDDYFGQVTMHFSTAHADRTAALSKGETVSAVCLSITEILGSPQLSRCEFASATTSPDQVEATPPVAIAPLRNDHDKEAVLNECLGSWIGGEGDFTLLLHVWDDVYDGGQITYSASDEPDFTQAYTETALGLTFDYRDTGDALELKCDATNGEAVLTGSSGFQIELNMLPTGQIG